MRRSLYLSSIVLCLAITACKNVTSPHSNPSDTTHTIDSSKTIKSLIWVQPAAGAWYYYVDTNWDSTNINNPGKSHFDDMFEYQDSGRYDTVGVAYHFSTQGVPLLVVPRSNGDILWGDTSLCGGYVWTFFRGVDPQTGEPNPPVKTVDPYQLLTTNIYYYDTTHHYCLGMERVTVPAGTFDAIKTQNVETMIEQSTMSPVGDTIWSVDTRWFAPSLANYVKREHYAVEHDTLYHERKFWRAVLQRIGP